MKRTVRVGALVTGIAALVVPAVLCRNMPASPHHAASLMLADGTQPPVPSGPMKPPAKSLVGIGRQATPDSERPRVA
jgi:hypothetical protein